MVKPQDNSYKWKIIAFVFIGLFTAESLIFILAFLATEEDSKKEAICITQYCSADKFEAYSYDVDTHICVCLNDNKIVEQHIIK